MPVKRSLSLAATLMLAVALILPAQAATKITFFYTPVNSWVGLFVAKEQGYLEKHGLDVDLQIAQNGSVISAALVADTAQIGGPTPTVMLQANEQGLDLVAVAGTGTYPRIANDGIVVRRIRGSRARRTSSARRSACPASAASSTC